MSFIWAIKSAEENLTWIDSITQIGSVSLRDVKRTYDYQFLRVGANAGFSPTRHWVISMGPHIGSLIHSMYTTTGAFGLQLEDQLRNFIWGIDLRSSLDLDEHWGVRAEAFWHQLREKRYLGRVPFNVVNLDVSLVYLF
jgi:hypothetical protein